MKKKDLKTAILRLLKGQEMHGYEIGRKLSAKGVTMQLGYLYRVLSEMRKEELIKSYWLKSNHGPKRKVYGLDTGGRQQLQSMLRDAIRTIHDFYGDYIAQLPPETGLLKWERLITAGVQDPKAAIFVITQPSVLTMYKMAVEYYCRKMGQRPVYLITDPAVEFDLKLSNLISMTGSHTDIPLRDNFADFTVAFDPPKPELLQDAVAEFHRVTREGGAAAIGFPNIEEQKDPLSIGAFIERIEHNLGDDYVNREVVESMFKRYFHNVGTANVLNFTFFIGRKKPQNEV